MRDNKPVVNSQRVRQVDINKNPRANRVNTKPLVTKKPNRNQNYTRPKPDSYAKPIYNRTRKSLNIRPTNNTYRKPRSNNSYSKPKTNRTNYTRSSSNKSTFNRSSGSHNVSKRKK
jgi:hypothetical protein